MNEDGAAVQPRANVQGPRTVSIVPMVIPNFGVKTSGVEGFKDDRKKGRGSDSDSSAVTGKNTESAQLGTDSEEDDQPS